MKKIHILDDAVSNQIAAGEVVERPASVIKELVENAMDAGAKDIQVSIEQGGLSLIRIEDDGEGISPEDMEFCFLRHATSKIETASDLYSLTTMGFRGEALASIAAVSRIEAISRYAGCVSATKVALEGGRVLERSTAAYKQGTSMTIRDLFFNTPVRKKFLKSEYAERHEIVDLLQKLALSRLDISFSLTTDGKQVFQTSGKGNLAEALATLFPQALVETLIPIKEETDFFTIHGLIGPAYQYRSSRDMQVFFVNRRYVRSELLQKTLQEAYRHRIPIRKYPVGIIDIEMNPSSIDVNIHPSKMEVKFSMEKTIRQELGALLMRVLDEKSDIRSLAPQPDRSFNYRSLDQEWTSFTRPILKNTAEIMERTKNQAAFVFEEPHVMDGHSLPLEKQEKQEKQSPENIKRELSVERMPIGKGEVRHRDFMGFNILQIIEKTYVIMTRDDRLFLLDQHAAHERVRYEQLFMDYQGEKLRAQFLLEPTLLLLSTKQKHQLTEHINDLEPLGIIVELFGEDEFLLRAMPAGFAHEDAQMLFQEVLNDLVNEREGIKEHMLELASCHGSIRSGDNIQTYEVQSLLESLSRCENPYTCPHGRPTILSLGKKELEKIFLRES